MGFSNAVLAELRSELARLQSNRAELDERIAAIQMILQTDSPKPSVETVLQLTSRAPVEESSFRDQVMKVLSAHPGVKAAFVTKTLRARGVTPGGDTPLGHRVYNEIWRLSKAGILRKEADGGFVVVKAAS